ncbi:MAG: fluoride efflux transporter CrcB [Sphingobacteriales bacterium]|nr:fluoride efflux transporter CrcB [Sphingobacteriales bacterium]
MMKVFLLSGLGGAIGAMLRVAANFFVRTGFLPYPTLLVNILGSFLIGCFVALGSQQTIGTNMNTFLITGICGGFTTFSAFSLENMHYLNDGKYLQAIIYITASFMLSILATWLGYKCIV